MCMYSAEHPRVWNQIENRKSNRATLAVGREDMRTASGREGKVGILVCRVRYCATYYLLLDWTGVQL